MNSPSMPPAGWYPDPANPAQRRYWNGAAWTEQVQPALVTPPQVPTFEAPAMSAPAPLRPQASAASEPAAAYKPAFRGKRKKSRRGLLWKIPAGLVAAYFVLGALAAMTPESAKNDSAASSSPTASAVAKPTETEAELKAAIATALDDLNRDGKRVELIELSGTELLVRYALNDNLSNELIIVGAWKDAGDILAAVQNSQLKITNIIAAGSLPLQDKYGQDLGERPVVTIMFESDAIEKANLEALPGTMLADAASNVVIHPVLRD